MTRCYVDALYYFTGDHLLTNVVSVHQGRKFQCYSSLLLEFGLIGEMMHDCENNRWMGPNRYNSE